MKITKDQFLSALPLPDDANNMSNFNAVREQFEFRNFDQYIAVSAYFTMNADVLHWEEQIKKSEKSEMYADSAQARSWDRREQELYRSYIKTIQDRIL